ncbi:MAG: 3',5'-nucleoside bisphosphate phosphatase [Pseudomonadota bacterium]
MVYSTVLNCDLHCHSTASDGLLSAPEVVRRASQNGVNMLALTDHDNLAGLPQARLVAAEEGLRFINGVEISIEWSGQQIHLLGFAFDAEDSTLNTGLNAICAGRVARAERIAKELDKIGIADSFAGAMRYAKNPNLISRAHFARYLVEIGVCKDVRSVFDKYLIPNRPGYVAHRWPTLSEACGWILGAGGVAAVAHPGRYALSAPNMRRFLSEFKDLGGQAIEVVSGSHSPEKVVLFTRLAKQYNFLASRGSDFHGVGESYTDLGKLAPLPDGLQPVWDQF